MVPTSQNVTFLSGKGCPRPPHLQALKMGGGAEKGEEGAGDSEGDSEGLREGWNLRRRELRER